MPSEAAAVRQLIASGAHKRAVEHAKELLRTLPGAASEALLAEAYIARALAFEPSMQAEARAILDLVATRCPSARDALAVARRILDVRGGRLDEIVTPLLEEAAAPESKQQVLDLLRRELDDLGALGWCAALPAGHPLRVEAVHLERALAAVTSGPVTDEEVALAEVPRRSALVAWKLLVRALVAFHRRDDEGCTRALSAIPPDTPPARLVDVLQALLRGEVPADPAGASLAARVAGASRPLRETFTGLDTALEKGRAKDVLRAIREAVTECRSVRPHLLDRLRQRISIRCLERDDLTPDRVRSAMGGAAVRDARFWVLRARAAEERGHAFSQAVAYQLFARHAEHEGLMTHAGPERAALLLRVADALAGAPADDLSDAASRSSRLRDLLKEEYADSSEPLRALAAAAAAEVHTWLDPGALYREAAAIGPRREVFERWLAFASGRGDQRGAEDAAQAWSLAHPLDPAPVLHLARSLEKRGAFQKALALLELADERGVTDPALARSRLRVLVRVVARQVSKGKADLALRAVEEIAALPLVRSERGAAFVLALRWVADARHARAVQWRDALCAAWGGAVSADVLLALVGAACGLRMADPPRSPTLADVAAACHLGLEFGIELSIPAIWRTPLLKQLRSKSVAAGDAVELVALARSAVQAKERELAFVAAGRGLQGDDRSLDALLLLMRAKNLPDGSPRRTRECLAAAAELARRARDTALLASIVAADPMHGEGGGRSGLLSLERIEESDLRRILERERGDLGYPRDREAPLACECPACAGRAGYGAGEDPFDEDEIDDLYDDDRPLDLRDLEDLKNLVGLPPPLMALFLEATAKYGRYGQTPTPEEVERRDPELAARIRKALLELTAGPAPRRRKRRRR